MSAVVQSQRLLLTWRTRLLPVAIHFAWLPFTLALTVARVSDGWRCDRRPCSSSAALPLIIFPSHYLSSSLWIHSLFSLDLLLIIFISLPPLFPSFLSQSICPLHFLPCSISIPCCKNESAHGSSWIFSRNTRTQMVFVVAMSHGQSVLFQMHRWESPNKFNGTGCCISP